LRVLLAPAHVYLSTSYGSEVSWAYNIIWRLAKDYGVRVDAICGKCNGLALPSNVKLFEVGFDKADFINRGLFDLSCARLSKKLYENVDIVHHMFPFGYKAGLNLLAVLGYLKNKPFVIGPIQYPQEFSDITDFMWASKRKGASAQAMYSLENVIVSLLSKPLNALRKATLNEAEALVLDSKKTFELFKSLYPDILKDKVLEVIPPGVETEIFQYSPPIKKQYFEILTAGYLLKRKGIQYLIEAMPLIMKEVKNVRLRTVGDGPYKSELMRIAKNRSLGNAVIFEGRVPRSRMVDYYRSCDIYVHPSLSETFPSTIREAMAVGRPVIATNIGFIKEHIIDGNNGFIVSAGDSNMLAHKILMLLSSEKLRLKMGMEGRKYAEANFCWDKLAGRWYEVYEKIKGES
jgi:glycosyltransferase involved in cell wall biosynthesis